MTPSQDGAITGRLPDLVPHIGVVQLGDAQAVPQGEQNRCPLGEGRLPLEETVRGLLAAGYQGFIEIELMGEDVETCEYADLLGRSRSVVEPWLK